MTFSSKQLSVTFSPGANPFSESPPGKPVKVEGLRMSISVNIVGLPTMNTADITIYGMTQDRVNRFTRAGLDPFEQRNDVVTINAGETDPSTGLTNTSLVYGGVLDYAYQDFQAAPEVPFIIHCATGIFQQLKGIPANSFPATNNSGTDVATIMSQLASQMGYEFESNGVSIQLANPYLWGPPRLQMQAVADAADIYAFIENEQRVVIIDKRKSRGGTTPILSAKTGMVGYPRASSQGLFSIRTLYNPAIKFRGSVEVKSSIPSLSGTFIVRKLSHTLECQMPNGAWYTDIDCAIPELSYPDD